MDKKNQAKVWDQAAHLWDKYKVKAYGSHTNLLNKFITNRDKKVLDLGCGSGRNFFKFKGTIYGVDFSSKMLKLAKENAEERGIKVELKKAEAHNLKFFKDNFFDKALYIAAIHCLITPLKRKRSLQELYRVLKPGGKAIITSWNKDSTRWKSKPKEKMVSWNIGESKVWRYYYLYSYDELKSLVESIGFKVKKISPEKSRSIAMIVEKPKK